MKKRTIINKKQIKALIHLWIDTEEELKYWCNKAEQVFLPLLYNNITIPVTVNNEESVHNFRITLIKLEVEKLCANGTVDRSRGEGLCSMLDNGGDDYKLAHLMITVLREQRLGI